MVWGVVSNKRKINNLGDKNSKYLKLTVKIINNNPYNYYYSKYPNKKIINMNI